MPADRGRIQKEWRWLTVNAVLTLGVVLTALIAVQISHQCRQRYAQLQEMQSSQWSMQENWGRLLLEESTWAAQHRVERVAAQRLQMRPPQAAEVTLVLP